MNSKKILLVDDSDLFLMLEETLLSQTGARCITARDGVEAVETAHRERPDLILMDLDMPNMNGLEAAEKILGDPSLASTPIIMVTGHSEEEAVERAMQLGCTNYVLKPIDVPELMTKVADVFGGDAWMPTGAKPESE